MKATGKSIRPAGPGGPSREPPRVEPREAPRDLASRLAGIESELASLAGSRPVDLLAQFARAFYFGTPLPYFTGRSDAELAGEIVQAFDFIQGRKPSEIRVRAIDSGHGSSLVQATMRDQPFILDSTREALHAEGVIVHRYLHPILRTERDDEARLKQVLPRPEAGTAESFLHFEVEPLSEAARNRVEKSVTEALREAAVATADYSQMRAAVESIARGLLAQRSLDPDLGSELEECADFLHWLLRGNFILLGYRSYDFEKRDGEDYVVVTPRSGLGILSNPMESAYYQPVPFSKLDPELRSRMMQPIFPLVSKTNREGRVHRRARMDYIGIKKLSPTGQVTGEHRILGFFTSQALNQVGAEIPVLRRKLAKILDRAQVLEGSHDYKEIVSLFNSLPKSELFATGDEEISRKIEAIMGMQAREEVRVDCRPDNLGRGVSVMVILPKDRFNSEVRERIQKAFASRLAGPPADYRLALGEEHFARLHFYFPLPPGHRLPAAAELEREVAQAIRTWEDALREELEDRFGPERAAELASRFAGALPTPYRSIFQPRDAVEDLPIFEELLGKEGVRVRISAGPERGAEPTTLLHFYRAGSKFYLSDIMPILTNLGLTVLDELTFRARSSRVPAVYLHTIRVQLAQQPGKAVPEERWPELTEAILALINHRYENDGLGGLVVVGSLTIRQVELLRTYLHYFRQLAVPYAASSMIAALVERPDLARGLVGHFETRFRPDLEGPIPGEERARLLEKTRSDLLAGLDSIQEINRDRILRGFLELIEATVRTNYFQRGGALPRIALKFQSRRISAMPRPVPLFEIFVHNAEMEGIHLRSGRVARGGIRWSDRRDDYRTEILGLMRTQTVKNAVIVPVGSKGGFVIKRGPGAGEDQPSLVARQYRSLICGMLDLTDNLSGGKLVHPPETVIYDGPDPYLVVAADKGTSTFSDLANSIAKEYGFWLDDAFASGGSQGYDHKKEGITARGAWECARQHFHELGLDPDGVITVAGIGDMSGDVFGNGLLLSQHFKLVAAFDHRHIFLDPAPDPAASYAERKRLFDLPRSSWADYRPALISRGGGVYARDAKRIDLSPEARALLDLGPGAAGDQGAPSGLTGEDLVKAVLKMPVDLLWNGGIGTYVKASSETHAEVGDSKNDAVRVDAAQLRARVVAEGGNLGFTQAARVEYALRGGKINTDFIDNSAGVDLSDHEVNIKIGLAEAIRLGRLDLAERDRLLKEMTADVCGRVLLHNRQQAQVISVEEAVSKEDLHDHLILAQELTEAGLLEARFERFPEAVELARRKEKRLGLLRPELALLLAFTKIEISRVLTESPLLLTAGFEEYLAGYFPGPLRKRFGGCLENHPLKTEIAATSLVNELAERVGITFVSRLRRQLGVSVEEAVRAYRVGDLLLDGESFCDPLRDVRAAGGVSPPAAGELLHAYRRGCYDVAYWLLRGWPPGKEGAPAEASRVLEDLQEPFAAVRAWLIQDAPAAVQERARSREGELTALGAPPELAARAVRFELERHVLPAVAAARLAGAGPTSGAAVYFALAGVLRLAEVEEAAANIPVADPDERTAARSLLAELRSLLVDLSARALAGPREEAIERSAERFLAAAGNRLVAYRQALPTATRRFSLGSLMVLVERLRRLVGK